MSKARKRHRQPWWKNKRKVKRRRQWCHFADVLIEVFPDGFYMSVADSAELPAGIGSDDL